MFVIVIVLLVIFVIALIASFAVRHPAAYIITVVAFLGAVGFTFPSVLWQQDVGESSALKDWGGNLQGYETEQGWHWKSPFVDAITFDVRNQRVVYTNPKNSSGDNSGGSADGREIAVVDKDGVNTNVDLTIRYSIRPDAVITVYKNFKNEDGLKSILINNDIRSVTRDQAGKLRTLQVLADHPKYANLIREALEKKWSKYGVSVDEVSIQQTDAPDSVKNAYAEAQKSQIEVQKAQNDLAATKVSAQQQVVQAQAQADANNILSASLTPQIIQQKYLDALKSGTVYVVPSGSVPYIGAK